MKEEKRKLKTIKIILIVLLSLSFLWGTWTYIELNRVRDDKRPIICFNETKDVEDNDEYYKMCYGLLYKYKEYYYKKTNELTGREFTLFFKDFERESDR